MGIGEIAGEDRLINLPGCPLNVENLTATIVHYLTFKEFPATGSRRRPLFAYGGLLHNQCERRAHFEFGEFALAWGDEGAQKGWCLYKLGCKGPETFANCPTAMYAGRTSWAVKAGHGCIGCTMPDFWDSMGPAYSRLPAPLPFAPQHLHRPDRPGARRRGRRRHGRPRRGDLRAASLRAGSLGVDGRAATSPTPNRRPRSSPTPNRRPRSRRSSTARAGRLVGARGDLTWPGSSSTRSPASAAACASRPRSRTAS